MRWNGRQCFECTRLEVGQGDWRRCFMSRRMRLEEEQCPSCWLDFEPLSKTKRGRQVLFLRRHRCFLDYLLMLHLRSQLLFLPKQLIFALFADFSTNLISKEPKFLYKSASQTSYKYSTPSTWAAPPLQQSGTASSRRWSRLHHHFQGACPSLTLSKLYQHHLTDLISNTWCHPGDSLKYWSSPSFWEHLGSRRLDWWGMTAALASGGLGASRCRFARVWPPSAGDAQWLRCSLGLCLKSLWKLNAISWHQKYFTTRTSLARPETNPGSGVSPRNYWPFKRSDQHQQTPWDWPAGSISSWSTAAQTKRSAAWAF